MDSRMCSTVGRLTTACLMLSVCGCAELGLPHIDPSGEHLLIFPTPPPAPGTCPPGTVPVATAPVAAAPVAFRPAAYAVAKPPSPYDDVAVTLTPFRVVQPVGQPVVLVAGVVGGDGYFRTNRRLEWSIVPGSVGQFVAIGQGSSCDFLAGDFTSPRLVTNIYAVGSTSRLGEQVPLSGPVAGPIAAPAPGALSAAAPPVPVLRGQGWISVLSPIEGTSSVTVNAPDVVVPQGRLKTATIYWVDAQYGFPPVAIVQAGSKHVLTTTVQRQSTACPIAGWIVRYEVCCGPQAIFQNGSTAIEVPTDQSGQSNAIITQPSPAAGTTQVRIQVIRPTGTSTGCAERLVVRDNASALVTWNCTTVTGTPSLEVSMAGPDRVNVGETANFIVTVINRGQALASGLKIQDFFREGFDSPYGRNPLERPLDPIAPGQSAQITIPLRVTQTGQHCHRVNVVSPDGSKAEARACVMGMGIRTEPAPRVVAPPVAPSVSSPGPGVGSSVGPGTVVAPPSATLGNRFRLDVEAPAEAAQNSQAKITATVTNAGRETLVGVTVSIYMDPVLRPRQASDGSHREGDKLVWTIASLPAGGSQPIVVLADCLQPSPSAAVHVTAQTSATERVDKDSYITIRPAPSVGIGTGGPVAGSLVIDIDDIKQAVAGEAETFLVKVSTLANTGQNNVVLTVTWPQGLTLDQAHTSGPTDNVRFQIAGNALRFDAVPHADPGQQLNYRVTILTNQPGPLTLHCEARSQEQMQPVAREKTVQIPPSQ